MDHITQTLLTTEEFDNGMLQQYELIRQQHEFIRTGFNITVDDQLGIMENQVIMYNILCSFRWILLTHIVMLFVIVMGLAYVMKVLEKPEKDEEVPLNAYVELKDPVCV